MSNNIAPIRDPHKIIRNAVLAAQRTLAVYIEPRGPDATRTVSDLLRILDDKTLLRALGETD